MVDFIVQCVIRSRNHETTVLYLSNLEHTVHNCALPTVVFVYVSVPVHVCGWAVQQSIYKYV